ncbi:MAG: entericidin A/B family lipoprotein [Verrucomicrobia bacterium]|nr:entericidin A/B family lipoprotein [Verrucomicrobiota bacterium]
MSIDHITRVQQVVLLLFVVGLLAIVGVGCRTAHGFGEDMQKAGENIQDGTK